MANIKTRMMNRKRLALVFAITCVLFLCLAVRLGWHQIIMGEKYAEMAVSQQTSDSIVPAVRGNIIDRNGKELAISATTNTIWIRPKQINGDDIKEISEEDKAYKEAEIATLSAILEMTEDDIRTVIDSQKNLVKLAKNKDKDVADAIRAENLKGIEVTEDAKRYYPLGSFASHIIGSTTDDNVGLSGLELEYNRFLAGENGRRIFSKDSDKNSLYYGTDKYYSAKDGYTLQLTIDENIQYIVEQALVKTKETTQAARVMCLIQDPHTGEVLAMAQTPGYDLNNPREPLDEQENVYVSSLSDADKTVYWNKMWRNFSISDTYEPGSTFKLITTAIALDEGVTHKDELFNCSGTIQIADATLKCWYYPRSHGTETLKQAVQNSCNPVMVQLTQRLGLSTYYAGLDRFGLTSPTNIDFPGEGNNILQGRNTAGPVGLATMGYGQGIAVTPISLVTAISSIANGGKLMQPRLVKALLDKDGHVVESYEPTVKKITVSQQTATDMLDIMESVVSEGGGGTAKIMGYRIGGKTGTANKPEAGGYSDTDVYASFVGVAPIDDPKLTILVLVDSPRGILYGSMTAAPAAKLIMEDVLRYMEIAPSYTAQEEASLQSTKTTVPDVIGQSMADAIGILAGKELSFSIAPEVSNYEDLVVVDQYPRAGAGVLKNSKVTLYYK